MLHHLINSCGSLLCATAALRLISHSNALKLHATGLHNPDQIVRVDFACY